MSYRIDQGEPTGDAVRRMVDEQIASMLDEINDSDSGLHSTIHQVRKRCKKVRAVLRLARGDLESGGTYSKENGCYRDAAKALSKIRDAQAVIETCQDLRQTFGKQLRPRLWDDIVGILEERRDRLEAGNNLEREVDIFAGKMRAARRRISDWPLKTKGFGLFAYGLKKTYKRGRDAMEKAYHKPTTEHFHEWRKRVKYHRYHVRMLRNMWEAPLSEVREELHNLSNYLGDDHDLAVFAELLHTERKRFDSKRDLQALLGILDHRRAQYQHQARPLGRKAFAEEPKHLCHRFDAYFDAWNSDEATSSSKLAELLVPASQGDA